MFGLILVILGVFFLLQEMGIIQGSFWGYLWPVLLIFVGLHLMDKENKKKNDWPWEKNNKKEKRKVVDEQ